MLFAFVGYRTREPGLGLIAVGLGISAVWYWRSDALPHTGPDINTDELRLWSIVIGAGVLVISAGVLRYLGLPRGLLRWVVIAFTGPGVLLLILFTVGQTVSHRTFHDGILLAYLAPAIVAVKRGVEHRGEAYWPLAAALLALTVLPHGMEALGVDPMELRHPAGIGLALFGMSLLVAILLRGQRALTSEVARRSAAEARLQESNVELEARVAERTGHLDELVAGLEAFNRGVSHDLRGPLSGMSQLARLAADELDNGDPALAREALPAISAQCEASTRMVSAMLDLARLSEVSPEIERVETEEVVRAAFEEVVMAHSGELGASAPSPELRMSELAPVCANARLLRTVFVNLLGNAVKFSNGSGDGVIEVDCRTPHRGRVILSVRDHGVGFSDAEATQLFEPFYRTRERDFDGHGLGLSIVRRAVIAMGGDVWAESPSDGGAQIFVQFAAADDHSDVVSDVESARV